MSFKTDFPQILTDFVTHRNFLYCIIAKEYIDFTSSSKYSNELFDEETKLKFYIFLFNATKDSSVDLFKYIKETDNPLKKKINLLVIKRVESLFKNLNDLLSYFDILELVNNVLSSFHERVDVTGNEGKGRICKYSVVGIFIKKFCLAFQAMPLEKIIIFVDGFKRLLEHYNIIEGQKRKTTEDSDKLMEVLFQLKHDRLSRDQYRWQIESLYNDTENVLFDTMAHEMESESALEKHRLKLDQLKVMYPDRSESMFLNNLLTVHKRDFELIENDLQMLYPATFLAGDATIGDNNNPIDNNTDNINGAANINNNTNAQKKSMLIKNFQFRQKLSETSLNSVVTLSAMGFKDEALMHYKDAMINAKLSRKPDLIAEVGSVGNSLMPINDNPNDVHYSKLDSNVNDKTALGSIRDFFLQNLHNNRSTLAELLNHYFSSPAPQRREVTSICLIYLSIIFRSFGFESMSNTYFVVAACLESIKKTKNHQEVLVEVFCQLISAFSLSGHFEKAFGLFKSLRTFGDGIFLANIQLQSSMHQTYFSHSLMRFNFSKAYACLEKLKQISLPEYGLRRVQMLFMEESDDAGIKLARHVISFAVKKRELLIYNHVSINKGSKTASSRIPFHKSSGLFDNSNETADLPTLDDTSSQNWGTRDWALYECRCRWLTCVHLINRRHVDSAVIHLNALEELSTRFRFYQYRRLCSVLNLAVNAAMATTDADVDIEAISKTEPHLLCPLRAVVNGHRAKTILSSRLGLSPRNHMVLLNLLVSLYVHWQEGTGGYPGQLEKKNEEEESEYTDQDNGNGIDGGVGVNGIDRRKKSKQNKTVCWSVERDLNVERHLAELREYCERCGDWMGQAHCWLVSHRYNVAIGNEEQASRSLFELELLLENRLSNVPNLDFLTYIL